MHTCLPILMTVVMPFFSTWTNTIGDSIMPERYRHRTPYSIEVCTDSYPAIKNEYVKILKDSLQETLPWRLVGWVTSFAFARRQSRRMWIPKMMKLMS
ncbi:hypothetical protein ScPMuIL_014630 [Solemya velum]